MFGLPAKRKPRGLSRCFTLYRRVSSPWRGGMSLTPHSGGSVGLSGCGMIQIRCKMVATGRDGVIPWLLGLLGIMSAFVQHMAGGVLIGRDGTSRNGYAVIPLGAESRHCRGFHTSPLGGSGFRPAASRGGRAWRSACSACSAVLGALPDYSRFLAVPRSRSEDAVPEAGTWTGPDTCRLG